MVGFPEELELLATSTTPSSNRSADATRSRRLAASGAGDLRLLHRAHADGRRPVLGHRRPGPGADAGDYLDRPADPFNDHEPVDSSAAAIGAQGLLRLGRWLTARGDAAGAATPRPA